MINGLGFGQPLDYQPWISFPGAIAGEWAGQLRLIGDAFGVEVQEVREDFDRAVTNETLHVAMGTVGGRNLRRDPHESHRRRRRS